MSTLTKTIGSALGRTLLSLLFLNIAGVAIAAEKGGPDLCGCRNHPGKLPAFNSKDPSTFPPGTEKKDKRITIPLPPDGVLVFEGFSAQTWGKHGGYEIWFKKNAGNTPVTLLVAGDVLIGKQLSLRVDGHDGRSGSRHRSGLGGLPGPGGYRGGDAAYFNLNGATMGGEGQGPGGGMPGEFKDNKAVGGGHGGFSGNKELLPLIGGSGGGGGASKGKGNCAGSGGGGGGGAILLAANGTVTIQGGINAGGGKRGYDISDRKCASWGGFGGGGAIRLIAPTITGGGWLAAQGGRGNRGGLPGVIRFETLEPDTMRADTIKPPAIRTQVIAPLVKPVPASVAITAVGGKAVPAQPQGFRGAVDVMVPKPGKIKIQIATKGVPAGTTVEVALKPQVGGKAIRDKAELNAANCNTKGECAAFIDFELASGSYFAEAAATFQTP